MQTQETRNFLGAIESGRVGRIIGPDLQERLARTFHVNFGSVRIGGEGESSPKGAIDYVFRQGEYGPPKDPEKDEAARERAKKAAELEYTAGDPEEVHRVADLIETSAAVRTGPRAERVLAKQVVELPADTDEEERAEAADALVADWKRRGHPAVAAVHCNGLVQPHVHVLAAARPVSAAGTVDRSVRLWTSKQEVRDERHEVARIVNAACKQRVLFNGGRHEDVGIDREPRRSIPRGVRIGEGRTEPDLEKVAEVREMHEKARASREREIREKPLRNAEKAVERAVASGAAAQERVDELKAVRAGSLDEDLVRVPDPIQPTERQRGAMEDALDRGGIRDADLDAALDQALAFAFLRIERARAREKEVRKRLAELEGGDAQAEIEAALEDERQKAAARPQAEAQPVPAAAPAERTAALAPGDLLKAGLAAEMRALAKWDAKPKDASPTARALEGIAGSPVLTFTPRGGRRDQEETAGAVALRGRRPLRRQGGAQDRAGRRRRCRRRPQLDGSGPRRSRRHSNSRTSARNGTAGMAPPTWARCAMARSTARAQWPTPTATATKAASATATGMARASWPSRTDAITKANGARANRTARAS